MIIFTILQWVFFALLGLVVLCAGAFGLMYLVSKTAVDFGKHASGCMCGPCQANRLEEHRRKVNQSHDNRPNEPREPDKRDRQRRTGELWISTIELGAGMFVIGGADRSKTYRVESVYDIPYGSMVRLIDIRTREVSSVPVAAARMRLPMWLIIATKSGEKE